jgi:hypothetical protein
MSVLHGDNVRLGSNLSAGDYVTAGGDDTVLYINHAGKELELGNRRLSYWLMS